MAVNISIFDENFRKILGLLFDQLRINFFAIDMNGHYIARNDSLTNIVGKTERADKVEQKAWDSCLQVMATGKHEMIEEEYLGKWYLSLKSPLYEEEKIIGVIGVSVDITDKKKAEMAKQAFTENMSHDLRTPFNGILTVAEMLHRKEEDSSKKEWLGDIVVSSKWLLSIMNQTLEVISNGNGTLKPSEFNVHDVVKETIGLLKAETHRKGLEITSSCPDAVIVADRTKLSRDFDQFAWKCC